MCTTKPTHSLIHALGLIEVAHVTSPFDHDELRVRNRFVKLTRHAERGTRVQFPPDEQSRDGNARQQVTLVGVCHQRQLPSEGRGTDVGRAGIQQWDELRMRLAGEQARKCGAKVLRRRGKHLAGASNPRSYLLCGQRAFPARVGIDHDQGRSQPKVAPVQLEHNGAALGKAGDVCRSESERLDQCREAVREVRELEFQRQIRGPASPRLVPGDDRELIRQSVQLRAPDAAVLGSAMDEDQRRPLTGPLVGDHQPVRLYGVHR